MKKTILTIILTTNFLFSIEVETLYEKTIQNNNNIKSLNEEIKYLEKEKEVSTKWNNPVLSVGINDINLNEPIRRDLEPMQASYIGLSQEIILPSKTLIKEEIAFDEINISNEMLKNEKLKLKKYIYEKTFDLKYYKKLIVLIKNKIKNLEKISEIKKSNLRTLSGKSETILEIEIEINQLKTELENVITNKKNIILDLENISHLKIDKIEVNKKFYEEDIEKNEHPLIEKYKYMIQKYNNVKKLEEKEKIKNPKISFTYFNRDNKYNDYVNISLSIPLSIYGLEENKIQVAQIKKMKKIEEFLNIKRELNNNIEKSKNLIISINKNIKVLEENIRLSKKIYELKINKFKINTSEVEEVVKSLNDNFDKEIILLKNQNKLEKEKTKLNYYKGK